MSNSEPTAQQVRELPPIRRDDGCRAETSRPSNGPDQVLDSASELLSAGRFRTSPLCWWRMLPAEAFRPDDYLDIGFALEEIGMVLGGTGIEPALYGDADAAISFVLEVLPITEVTLKVDIIMTPVLRCALNGDLRAALVLAHIVERAGLDPAAAADLCASWFLYYLRSSPTQRSTPAERALMKALRRFDSPRPHDGGAA
jgi:hypothetical protein